MNHIEYPDRYEAAIKANIISNAQKTFSRNVEDAEAIIAWCAENAERNNFAASLYGAYWDYGKLTEKQCAVVREQIKGNTKRQAEWKAKQAAEAALAEPVPAGRHAITGVVLSTREERRSFGYDRSDWCTKILVKDDRGFKVWGTAAGNICSLKAAQEEDGVCKGDTVTFTATLTPSDDDPKFGFFKRPSGAAIIARATLQEEEEK